MRGNPQANGGAGQANANANTFMGNANGLFSTLAPTLRGEVANPTGFSPATRASMLTGAQQTAGGATAGASGKGALLAGRTRNAGTADAAIADATRAGGEQLSKTGLDIQNEDAVLKEHQRQSGIQGLQGMYGTNVNASNQSLGEVAANVNANTQAAEASWDWAKYILDPALAASGAAGAAKLAGCWIAEAIYGFDDPRTHLVRRWLNGPFRETRSGNAVMAVYIAIGQPVAWVARRSSILRAALKPLFDMALRRAHGH